MSAHLDLTLDASRDVSFRNRAEEWIRTYKWLKNTYFTYKELCCILYMYQKLQRENLDATKPISSSQFHTIFHTVFGMPDSHLLPRIFYVLIGSVSTKISVSVWMKTMNLFLKGTLNEKIDYCFEIYDGQRMGEIRRDQMMILLRKTIFKHEVEDLEEAVKDFVEIILNKMDLDRDGKISKNDYAETVRADPNMLECFGQCLPDRTHVYAFLMTFSEKRVRF